MASLGINAYLVRWANLIHHECGLDHLRCHVTDGGLIVAPPDRGRPQHDRGCAWENRTPAPSWISVAWRERDDHLHTGARSALARLLKDAHTEPYAGGELDWPSWRTFAAAQADPQLTMADLTPDLWAIGHSTVTTAAVLRQDSTILANRPDSPSLAVLRDWLTAWKDAGRPAPETYTPALAVREAVFPAASRDTAVGGGPDRLPAAGRRCQAAQRDRPRLIPVTPVPNGQNRCHAGGAYHSATPGREGAPGRALQSPGRARPRRPPGPLHGRPGARPKWPRARARRRSLLSHRRVRRVHDRRVADLVRPAHHLEHEHVVLVRNLGNPRKFELLEESDAVAADPRYTRLLTAMAAVHGAAATPRDYARAAYDALVLQEGAA
ncbi:DUF6354 family protein [Streptomyces sp. NPDC059631]|uniref:DUF6354 family protein n=1 Tax=unclassified Streptomyces TaxID=2593676 RepID=UPI0036CB07B7